MFRIKIYEFISFMKFLYWSNIYFLMRVTSRRPGEVSGRLKDIVMVGSMEIRFIFSLSHREDAHERTSVDSICMSSCLILLAVQSWLMITTKVAWSCGKCDPHACLNHKRFPSSISDHVLHNDILWIHNTISNIIILRYSVDIQAYCMSFCNTDQPTISCIIVKFFRQLVCWSKAIMRVGMMDYRRLCLHNWLIPFYALFQLDLYK